MSLAAEGIFSRRAVAKTLSTSLVISKRSKSREFNCP